MINNALDIWRPAIYGGGTDTDALNWRTRVLANGGTVSAATLAAKQTLYGQLKSSGLWAKIDRLNLVSGDQLAAMQVPDKVGSGYALETLVNFVGGDYAEATGLTGDGSTKLISTGALSSSYAFGDHHLFLFASALQTSNVLTGFIGTGDAPLATAPHNIMYQDGGTSSLRGTRGQCVDNPTVFYIQTTAAAKKHWLLSSTSAALTTLYGDGASVGTNTNTKTSMGSGVIELFCLSYGTTLTPNSRASYSAMALRAYSIGKGFNATDAANYYTYMNQYQTALGRG